MLKQLKTLYNKNKTDFGPNQNVKPMRLCFTQVTWVVTFLASLFLGLDLGLAVGIGAELFTVVCRTQL